MSEAARKIRVLVVDDSVVMRRLLSEAIASDAELEVAGYAANGQIALSLLDQVKPDLVTLDVEMPVMNGLVTLKAIRASGRKLPIIMFSTLTNRGAEATIDALAAGASDYLAKPAGAGDYTTAKERIREALLPKVKALCRRPATAVPRRTEVLRPSPRPLPYKRRAEPINVVAIGCSTGGPNALTQLLPAIPADFPAAIVIVQHMPPAFTRFLSQRLSSLCQLPVEEAEAGAELAPGKMWVAPGGSHLVVERDGAQTRLATNQNAPENSCRPSVDVLFRSVAQVFGNRALGVVLTGMGQDGLRGCESLAAAGAEIVVQDEATSVVWGMPGFVARAGLADTVLPIAEIGSHLLDRVASRRLLSGAFARSLAVAR
jgi:two-component system chemotaxis response regulator CheB